MSLKQITDELVEALEGFEAGPPVTYVYNPLRYARAAYDTYLRRYVNRGCPVVLLGMNPGPFGMAQTGVPFGDVRMVRDWLGIDKPVGAPARQHPKRPVEGFDCLRPEVSGQRLWGWARDRFGTPGVFFQHFTVINYCPLCFMEESGKNRTPDKLSKAERDELFAICDQALRRTVEDIGPARVIGIGGFTTSRIKAALKGLDVRQGRIPHPSPASPIANKGWAAAAEKALAEQGINLPRRP